MSPTKVETQSVALRLFLKPKQLSGRMLLISAQCLILKFSIASTNFLMQEERAIGRNLSELFLGTGIIRKLVQSVGMMLLIQSRLRILSKTFKQSSGMVCRQL